MRGRKRGRSNKDAGEANNENGTCSLAGSLLGSYARDLCHEYSIPADCGETEQAHQRVHESVGGLDREGRCG